MLDGEDRTVAEAVDERARAGTSGHAGDLHLLVAHALTAQVVHQCCPGVGSVAGVHAQCLRPETVAEVLGNPAVGQARLEELPRHRVDLGQALRGNLACVGLVRPTDQLLDLAGGRLELEHQGPAHRGQRDPRLDVRFAGRSNRLAVGVVLVAAARGGSNRVAVPQVGRRLVHRVRGIEIRHVLERLDGDRMGRIARGLMPQVLGGLVHRVRWRVFLEVGDRVGQSPDSPGQRLGQVRVGHVDVTGVQQRLQGPADLQATVDRGDQMRPHGAGLDRGRLPCTDEAGQEFLPRGPQRVVVGQCRGRRRGEVRVDAPPKGRGSVVVGQSPFA